MAKWIPGGFDNIAGLKTIRFKLEVSGRKEFYKLNSFKIENQSINIGGINFFMLEASMSLEPTFFKQSIILTPVKPPGNIEKAIEVLQKFGNVTPEFNQEVITIPRRGSIQHDLDLKKMVSTIPKIFVGIQDTLKDRDGNKFQITKWREYEAWCDDCRDVHSLTETILEKKFKTKKEAMKFYKSFKVKK